MYSLNIEAGDHLPLFWKWPVWAIQPG
jgi:hypothetical protein